MPGQEQSTALVRAAYDALARGDIAALAPLLAVDAVAHEYSGSDHHATYQGRPAILARLDDLAWSYWDDFRVQVHTVAGVGPLTAAIATWQGASRVTGRTYIAWHVLVARVADRQVTEVWLIRDAPTHIPEP